MTDTIVAAIIGFIGVIIGAVLTAGFTWFIEYLRAKREEKIYLKRKKEEAYLSALETILNSVYISDSETWFQQVKSTSAKVALYLSSDEFNNFFTLIKEAKTNKSINGEKMEDFVKYCKEKLGIKD